MIWQDLLLMIGSFGLILGLLPSLFGKRKPEFSTSLFTAYILLYFAAAYFTLGLWLAFTGALLTSLCWFILAYQVKR
jgi:hypothetical protein